MILRNEALQIKSDDIEFNYTKYAIEVYKNLNQEKFQDFSTINLFADTLSNIFKAHNQHPIVKCTLIEKPSFGEENKKVCLLFSGGLDSVYQALYLKELGYDVTLLHCANANVYSNFQETKASELFANKFNFKLITVKFTPNHKTEFKKYWQENSFKNSLMYCIAVDYMVANNIYYLSSGDDLRLSINDSVCGTNTGDSKEITMAFMNSFNIKFIPVDSNINKAMRLSYLHKFNARDYYISCVGPGRLIKSQHRRYEEKYNVKLDAWSCGCGCRKDSMHLLLDKYYNGLDIPIEMEKKCWEKLAVGADEPFFKKTIPLEQRIKNLIEY